MNDLYKLLPDGLYFVSLYGQSGTYHMEKRIGKWFFSDGTGWREEMDYPEAIVNAREISHLPRLERSVVYENTYPLTDLFPKHVDT